MDTTHEVRHTVKIEVQSVIEPLVTEEIEEDRDHLLEIHEMLESMDWDDEQPGGDEDHRTLCFDLCSDCFRKYIQDPLGAEAPLHVGFSHN
jgi:hypothetical protein